MTKLYELQKQYKKEQRVHLFRLAMNKRHSPIGLDGIKVISKKVRGRAGRVANRLIKNDIETEVSKSALKWI